MILPFSIKDKSGKPNHFVEKVWASLFPIIDIEMDEWVAKMAECKTRGFGFGSPRVKDFIGTVKPKRHTLRADEKDRWNKGNKIHPVVFNRTKDQFQFTPVLECKSIQAIEIHHPSEYMNDTEIKIDGRLLDIEEMQQLAWNDGFACLAEFHLYFDEDFNGKIIHWTDLKY